MGPGTPAAWPKNYLNSVLLTHPADAHGAADYEITAGGDTASFKVLANQSASSLWRRSMRVAAAAKLGTSCCGVFGVRAAYAGSVTVLSVVLARARLLQACGVLSHYQHHCNYRVHLIAFTMRRLTYIMRPSPQRWIIIHRETTPLTLC